MGEILRCGICYFDGNVVPIAMFFDAKTLCFSFQILSIYIMYITGQWITRIVQICCSRFYLDFNIFYTCNPIIVILVNSKQINVPINTTVLYTIHIGLYKEVK